MTKQRSFAVTLFPPFATAAALHTALMLFAFREAPIADHLGLGIWWLFLAGYQLVMTRFLQSPRELRSIVLLSALFVGAQFTVTFLYAPIYPTFTGWFAAIAMWIATYYQSVTALTDGIKPEAVMIILEANALTLLFCAAVIGSGAIVPGVMIHLCISLFCVLIAMMRQRTLHTRIDANSSQGAAGLLPLLILLGITVFAIVTCLLISGSAARILTQLTAWLLQLLQSAGHVLGTFFFWLLSLFPPPATDVGEEMFAVAPLPSGLQEQVSTNNGIVLYLIILAVAAGLMFCVLKIWRTMHLQGKTAKRRTLQTAVVKKSSFWESIKRFLKKIYAKIRFNLLYLRSRNTAPGLLVWTERQMRRRRFKRQKGETPSAFLKRVGTRYPACQAELIQFSAALDRYYFGGGSDLPPETVRSLRKTMKQAFSQTNNLHKNEPHS